MTAYLAQAFNTQFFDGSAVAAGYSLYTYDSGTTTPKTVYKNQAGTTAHTNPIVLDPDGMPPGGTIWITSGEVTFVLKDTLGATVWTRDDIAGQPASDSVVALSDATQGDALIAVKGSFTGSKTRTQHDKNADVVSLTDATSDDLQTAIDALYASGKPGGIFVPNGEYTDDSTATIEGEFPWGVSIRAEAATRTTSHAGPSIEIGDATLHPDEFRQNARVSGLNLTGPGSSGSVGVQLTAIADVFLSDGVYKNFDKALNMTGALIIDTRNLTLRDSGYGLYATQAHGFSPNSIQQFGNRIIKNGLAVYTSDNSQGVCANFGVEIEGNNQSGNDTDGKKIVHHNNAGYISYFGSHFENNPGQYNLYYDGDDVGKCLLVAGCQLISGSAEQLHIEQGTLTALASRITTGGKLGTVFGTNTAGTMIDIEGDISGTLDNVMCIRYGRIGYGAQPISTSPLVSATPATIAKASNIVEEYSNDTIKKNYKNAAGTRIGYWRMGAASDAIYYNDINYGHSFYANGAIKFHVSRGGAASVEPGVDNTISCGSGSLRFSVVYSATGTINTSDATLKQDQQAIEATEALVAADIKALIKRFRFKDAVQSKGDAARLHFGVMAQDVEEAFIARGLDPNKYAMFCSDEWTDENGVTHERKGIRYEELLCFVMAVV